MKESYQRIFLVFISLFMIFFILTIVMRIKRDLRNKHKVEYQINMINIDSIEVTSSHGDYYIVPFDSLEETILKDNL